jgi:hypothetical protein
VENARHSFWARGGTKNNLANAPNLRAVPRAVCGASAFCGVVVPGSGGVRKVRFGFGGRGKSGGARIIYLFGGEDLPVFVLAAFAKNEKADLSVSERNALGRMVRDMIENYRRQK